MKHFSCHSLAHKQFSTKEQRLCYEQPETGATRFGLNTEKIKSDVSGAWNWTKEKTGNAFNWTKNQLDSGTQWTAAQVSKLPNGVQRMWRFITLNPSVEEEQKTNMISSLQNFLVSAPPAVTDLVGYAVERMGPTNLTPEQLAALTDHRNWAKAFNDPQVWQDQTSDDFYHKQDDEHRMPSWLLKTLKIEQRKQIYQDYVTTFVPEGVRKKFDTVFGARDVNDKDRQDVLVQNRDKISLAMQAMLGGDMPKPEQDPGNTIQDIAFEGLQERYNAKGNFKSPLMTRDAQRSTFNPDAPSFFTGAMKHGVLPQDVVQALQTTLKNDADAENLSGVVLHDKLLKLDTNIKIQDANNILGKMETWEKAALLLIAAYALVKHTKLAIGGVLTYLGIKYIGGVKDPLGSGIGKVKEGWDYLAGKTEKMSGNLLFNHEKDPASVAKTMVRFARGEDLHNVEDEAYILSVLNAKTMTQLSNAYIRDEKGWSLNLELLFGGRKNIPPHFKDKDYCQSMTNAIGYLLFSHYRSVNPGDPDVKTVTDRMASLDFTESWEQAQRKDVKLGKMYDALIVKGKMSAGTDSRQLHKFVEDQIGKFIVTPTGHTPNLPGNRSQNIAAAQPGSRGNTGGSSPKEGDRTAPAQKAPTEGGRASSGQKPPKEGADSRPADKAPSAGVNRKPAGTPPLSGDKANRGEPPPTEGNRRR